MNIKEYKGYKIRTRKSSTGKVIEAVVLGQNAYFRTIKSAKSFINSIV